MNLPRDLSLPDYTGGSLINLPPTIGHLLGATTGWSAPPLRDAYHLSTSHEKVVLLLVDGFGARALERDPGTLADLLEKHGGVMHELTSVAPSTTCVATTSIHASGASPIALGTLGYTQFLPNHGTIGNMLFFQTAWSNNPVRGELESYGIAPETMLPEPSIFETLAMHDVTTTALMPLPLLQTPLSRMQYRGVTVEPYIMWHDLFEFLFEHLGRTTGRSYHYAYITEFDTLGHGFGEDFPTRATLRENLFALLDTLLTRIRETYGETVKVLVTADHGMQTTPPEHAVHFEDLPGSDLIHQAWAGEPRHVLIRARSGQRDNAIAAIEEVVGEKFFVTSTEAAVAHGIYGDPALAHPESIDRLGDIVLLARGDASLLDGRQRHRLRGMHGSLTANELLVPLLAF